MKKAFFLFLSFLVVSCQWFVGSASIKLDPKEFQAEINTSNFQLIDVRKPNEFAVYHIESAKNLNYFSENFADSVKLLDPNTSVLIYCRSGKRSAKSVSVFKEAGFNNIYELEGGILNWRKEGLVTVPK